MASERTARRWAPEDGNTLLLMPVGVLVVLVLSAIAVDAAIMFTAQRDAQTVADGVARSATGAVDEDALFDDGVYLIDTSRAAAAADSVLANRPADELAIACAPPVVPPGTPDVVEVTCEVTVDLIFSSAFRADASYTADGTGTARAAQD